MSPSKTRKWPKLNPGEQIRIRHIPSGKYVWKPKGSSGSYELKADDFTVWSSFKGPGNFINEQLRRAENLGRGWSHRNMPLSSKAEDFVIEIVVMEVVRCINVEDQLEKQRQIELEEMEDKKYRSLSRFPGVLSNSFMDKDKVLRLIEGYREEGGQIRSKHNSTALRVHEDDAPAFIQWVEEKIVEAML